MLYWCRKSRVISRVPRVKYYWWMWVTSTSTHGASRPTANARPTNSVSYYIKITVIHWGMWHPSISSVSTRSSHELQRLDLITGYPAPALSAGWQSHSQQTQEISTNSLRPPLCVSKLSISGSGNGLSPGQCQATIWSNAVILLIRNLRTNFIEILSEINTFIQSRKCIWKCHLRNGSKFASASMCWCT